MNQNPEHQFLTDRQVSELTGRGLQTLRNDRFKGQGLPYTKFGRLCRYRLADVLQYLEQHKVMPGAE
jgi:predicted DNA-binding transcriptional regulator AlpA